MAYSLTHQLWRLVPQRLRRQVFHSLTTFAAPRPDHAPPCGPPVAVVGAFRSASGLGEGARLAYAALAASGFEPAGFDVSAALDQCELPSQELRPLVAGTGGSLIVHINAPYFAYALRALGRAQIRGRRIVGYWAWELPRLPADWNAAFQFVHEIWVPSHFTKNAVAAATELPVHVVAHPIPQPEITPLRREEFQIPADALVVLTVFHLGSAFSRKNPVAAIAAFRRAFGDATDKVLIVKLVDPGGGGWARRYLREAIAGARNIHLIDRMLSPPQMAGLTACADIVVSLHRAEGFGLVLAQAMQLGKPVVATAWSGNLDFMTEANSALVRYSLVPVRDPEGTFDMTDQKWAEADVEHAAEWFIRLAQSRELRQRLGAAAAADMARQFGPPAFAQNVRRLLGMMR
jgi:glycosyltransferase involved in cell wall biosynthesis